MAQSDSLPDRFDTALFTTMQHIGPQLVQEMDLELTPGQVFMLHFIREQPNCSASALSDKMEVNPSAVTVMLDRLEHHGFVLRQRSKKDRRMIVIQLTETGRKALSHVMDIRRIILAYCFNKLNPKEPELLVELLEHVAKISSGLNLKEFIASCSPPDMEKRKEKANPSHSES
ncbi:MarR family winged helix-turn-helix transcriptional regulator [Alicyclobacillus sp. SO9]|uniref:MarR family winged helix-turn-helix transcriptional regulator n=1 Tax=Alicyclobacillus sp. SO9 TaxID=2665646 RepID=UPI0018E6FCA3|nr:MarR family transcriptional regulator [Alicyclobacillus sp. SO9]QQE78648.1 MarR family transcriptional regulator [Alicyclobacillus sp. SO9]